MCNSFHRSTTQNYFTVCNKQKIKTHKKLERKSFCLCVLILLQSAVVNFISDFFVFNRNIMLVLRAKKSQICVALKTVFYPYTRPCLKSHQQLLTSLCQRGMGVQACWKSLCEQLCLKTRYEVIFCTEVIEKFFSSFFLFGSANKDVKHLVINY